MQNQLGSSELMEILDCPQGHILGLRLSSEKLRQHFDTFMDTAENIMGPGVQPYPLSLSEGTWMLSNPQSFVLEGFKETTVFDENMNVIAASPDLDCIEGPVKEIIGGPGCAATHDKDMARCLDAVNNAYEGSDSTVDYRIPKGNNNIINTCTFRPYVSTQNTPFLVGDVSHGYAQRGHA